MATKVKADPIYAQTFGGLTIYCNNVPKVVKWQSNKARLLFCYLIVFYNQWVHRDRLIELLWPGSDPATCEKNFLITLTRLRGSLNEFNINAVIRMGEAYRLNFEAVTCDYVTFFNEATAGIKLLADGETDSALARLAKAEEICTAEFLPEEPSAPLLQELRCTVQKLHVMVMEHLKSLRHGNTRQDFLAIHGLPRGTNSTCTPVPEVAPSQPKAMTRTGRVRRPTGTRRVGN